MSIKRRIDGIHHRPRKRSAVVAVHTAHVVPKRRPLPQNLGSRLVISGLLLTAGYVILAPYVPDLFPPPSIKNSALRTVAAAPATYPKLDSGGVPYFGKNTLTIPEIGVNSEILEGVDEKTLDRGLWRRPNSSTPELGGNTVIAAHRFKYTTGPNTFYYLDRLKVGDQLSLTWKGRQYRYQVTSSTVVSANDTSVEAASDQPILTLYTCTPLWTSQKRLVVRASLLQ